MTAADDEARLLSRILFEARERVDMAILTVENITGQRDEWGHRLRDEIDTYRGERGWSPDGYGGERAVDAHKGTAGCKHNRFVAECLDCGARPLEGLR